MTTEPQQIESVERLDLTSERTDVVGSELSRLAVQSSHYLAGFVGSLAFGLVSFPIFTRVFPIAEYGLIDLASKVLLLLWAGSKMGLQNAALRFYDGPRFAGDAAARQSYFSTLYFGVLSSASVVALMFVIAAAVAPSFMASGPLLRLAYLIITLLLLRSLSSILWSFLRVEERTRAYNAITVATKAATLAAVCALLPVAGRTARTYFLGLILVEAVLVVGLTAPMFRRGLLKPDRFDPAFLRAGIAYGAPLVIYEFSFNILGATDRFLVRHFLGAEALGFYSVAYGLAQHVNDLLFSPLSLALTPMYMRIWTSEGREKTIDFLSRSFDLFLMGAAGILAVATASAHDAVLLLASPKYAGADHPIPLLLLGLLVFASHLFLAAGLLIHKRTLPMAGALVVSAGLNIGLNWFLLPRMGLMGGALAALLSYSFCVLVLARISRRLLPLHFDVLRFATYLAAAGLAWLAAAFIDLGSTPFNLACKSLVALAVYSAVLYALDHRVRQAARWLTLRCMRLS